jgi:peptidoglycan/LPS O-acetylase OafA/YrhL
MFYLGYLLASAGPRFQAGLRARSWSTVGLLLAATVVFLRSRQTRFELWGEPLGALGILACLIHGPEFRIYRLLDHAVSRFYGRVSYSFYLLHFPVLYAISGGILWLLPPGVTASWGIGGVALLAVGSVLAATPLSWLFWRGLEQPGIRLSKFLCRRRPERAADEPIRRTRSASVADAATDLVIGK